MATDSIVRARISPRVKKQATAVLDAMGLSVSDAIRMMLVRVAAEKALPFDVKMPNSESRAAIDELRSGKGAKARNTEELMTALDADD